MVKYLGAIIIIIVVASGIETGAGLDRAIDALSLLFVIGVAVGHALGAKDGENKITRFGDGCVRGGWLGFLVGVSLIAVTDFAARMDFSMIMPAMAVALLAPLYGYFFKIITMQLEWFIKFKNSKNIISDGYDEHCNYSNGAVRRMRTRIGFLAQPEPMRSIIGGTQ